MSRGITARQRMLLRLLPATTAQIADLGVVTCANRNATLNSVRGSLEGMEARGLVLAVELTRSRTAPTWRWVRTFAGDLELSRRPAPPSPPRAAPTIGRESLEVLDAVARLGRASLHDVAGPGREDRARWRARLHNLHLLGALAVVGHHRRPGARAANVYAVTDAGRRKQSAARAQIAREVAA